MIEAKLSQLNITLPETPAPKGNYLPCVRSGNILYLSGTLPIADGKVACEGAVGLEKTIEEAYEGAKLCVLNSLSVVKSTIGNLDQVERIISLTGFVYAQTGFRDSPKVINGASDLLVEIFGEKGKHSRAAVTVSGLPSGATVEIQMIVEVSG